MVKIISLSFTALFAVASLAQPVKRTVAQIESDIASISSQLGTLDRAITAFPATGGSLIDALGIHSSSTTLDTTIETTNTDVVNTGALPESDAQTILTSLQAIVPTIQHALTQIADKKSAFQALPIGGIPALVKQDLGLLSGSTTKLASSFIVNTPADLLTPATAVKDDLAAAFAQAIAAYADV